MSVPASSDDQTVQLRLAAELPALHRAGHPSLERAGVESDPQSRRGVVRPVGRARKVSVSMPEDLTAAVQRRVGRGEFSHYVTEAVAKQLELDLLAELANLLEDEHGPVSEDLLGGSLTLDSEGLSKLATADQRARAYFEAARRRRARVVVSAVTLTEVLRGGSRDTPVHRVLSRVTTQPVTLELARLAGELLGAVRLSGHRYAIDAVVAATALRLARPVLLLTSDPDDLGRLVEEPDRRKDERVVVIRV